MTSVAPRRVAVIGPTASGKSALALAFAERRSGVEIVSVDSMQVYRGMDIGTASPSAAERAAVAHHLIDVCDPTEEFTVARFRDLLDDALLGIAARDAGAVLVGGTGLYHRCAIDGLDLAGGDDAVRARLEAEAVTVGAPALHERLRALDPEAADRMEPSNTRRVVRALEVIEVTGRPFSSFGDGLDRYPPTPVAQLGLRWDRAVLAERIERRVHAMMAAGLLAEVERVLNAHPGVVESGVVGVPHPHTGESVKAFIVAEPGRVLEEDDLIEWCATELARYKCPTKIDLVDEIPRGLGGKIIRRELGA